MVSLSIFIRAFSALVIGTVIGIDRELKRRGAGIKAHTLVCLGAALVMMTGQYIYTNFPGNMDISRLGAQVISGVGFLAVGIGFVQGAFITLILVVITLKLLTKIDIWLQMYAKVFDLYLEFPTNKCVSLFVNELHAQGVKINGFELGKSKIKGEGPTAILSIEVQDRRKRTTIVNTIRGMECVKFVEVL